ncbi:hypothetical protein Plhal304r1_c014g0053291 [Plasmopara halstedii]
MPKFLVGSFQAELLPTRLMKAKRITFNAAADTAVDLRRLTPFHKDYLLFPQLVILSG